MRILLTTDCVGGVWTFTRELTPQLLACGHSVALISFGRALSPEQDAWCADTSAAYRDNFFHHASTVPLEWMSHNHTAYSEGSSILLEQARSFHPDIFHSSQFCFGSLPLPVPCVVTAHSDVLSWAAACRPLGLAPSPWLDRYQALVEQGLQAADAVAAPTRSMLEALSRNFTLPADSSVIPNGRSLRMPEPRPTRRMQAVSVGRLWDEAKGLSTLLAIDSPMPILVAGEDSFDNAAVIPHSLNALGRLAEDELLALFHQSSLYLATSLYEPFGLAPLEAALCGCALIVRDLPSFHEVWGDSATYFKDASHLQQLLETFADDPDALTRAQAAALRRAGALTAERMSARYIALYARLLHIDLSRGAAAADAA